jgi:hypothetical protein
LSWSQRAKRDGVSAANVPSELSATANIELTIVVSEMAMNDAPINAHEARNARLPERKRNRIRCLSGFTEQPASAEGLLANAENLTDNHRRTLARNISTGAGMKDGKMRL